jgi:hypothetical protein
MTEIVAPKPEFLSLSEQAVLPALDDPANPIAIEVARLVATYTNNFRSHVERIGYIRPTSSALNRAGLSRPSPCA